MQFTFDQIRNIDTNNLCTIDIEHTAIWRGLVFDCHEKVIALDSSASADFLFVPDSSTLTMIHMFGYLWDITGGPADVLLYESVTVSSLGTPLVTSNKNRLLSNTSHVAMYSNPIVTGLGTLIEYDMITTASLEGGSDPAHPSNHTILNPARMYLFRLTNNSPARQTAHFCLKWFESAGVPESAVVV